MSKAPRGWEYVEGGDEVNGTVPFGNSGREAERKEAMTSRLILGGHEVPYSSFDYANQADAHVITWADAVSKTECWADDPDPYDADLCHIIALMNAGV